MVVRREPGDLVEIATADIVSGKPVPPRPSVHRRLDPVTADRLALPGWRPVETEPLGEWVLRASGGFSSRGNSVLALGDPGLPTGRGGRASRRVVPGACAPPASARPPGNHRGRRLRSGRLDDLRGHLPDAGLRRPGCCDASSPDPTWTSGTRRPSTTAGWPATSVRPASASPRDRCWRPARSRSRPCATRPARSSRADGVPSTATGSGVSSLATREEPGVPAWAAPCSGHCWSGVPSGAPRRVPPGGRLEHRRPGALPGLRLRGAPPLRLPGRGPRLVTWTRSPPGAGSGCGDGQPDRGVMRTRPGLGFRRRRDA